MKKKWFALVMATAMTVGVLTGCGKSDSGTSDTSESADKENDASENADGEGDASEEIAKWTSTEEKVEFSITGVNTMTGEDYEDDFTKYLEEKFNVDITVQNNEFEGEAERVSTAFIGGTMADAHLWLNFDWGGYYDYVDQGLFAPMPENWETIYPNLYKMVKTSGYMEQVTVDGQIYALPHAMYGNLVEASAVTEHFSVFFRKDLAKQVGMENLGADGTIKLSELKEYLKKLKENNLIEKSTFGGTMGVLLYGFGAGYGIPYADFMDTGSEYIWKPTMDNYEPMLEEIRDWYESGLLDADFYQVTDKTTPQNEFNVGKRAAFIGEGASTIASGVVESAARECNLTPDDVGVAIVRGEDDTVYAYELGNYWTATVFNPDIDEKVMARILTIMDWACDKEGQISVQNGIPEKDWVYNEDGTVNKIKEDTYSSWWAFFMLGWCGDDLAVSGLMPGVVLDEVQVQLDMIADQKENGELIGLPKYYNTFTGDEKSSYSGAIDTDNMAVKIACGTEDIHESLQNYIEENRSIWEPLVEAVEAHAGY